MPQMLENIPYADLEIGQAAEFSRRLEEQDLKLFAVVSGDFNPLHLDEDYAKGTRFRGRIAHGMWTGGLISAALATVLPGPGCIYLEQSLRFHRPVRLNDQITVRLEVSEKNDEKQIVTLACQARNQEGETVVSGVSKVIAATAKIRCPVSDPGLPPWE